MSERRGLDQGAGAILLPQPLKKTKRERGREGEREGEREKERQREFGIQKEKMHYRESLLELETEGASGVVQV